MTGQHRLCPLRHRHRVPDEGEPCTRCERQDTAEKDCPRSARSGSLLCSGHLHGLRRDLVEIPGYFEAMLGVDVRRGQQAKTARTDHSEVGVGDPALDHRQAVHATLASWVRLVAEEARTSRLPADDVTSMCRWLLDRFDWLSSAQWADELAVEMADLHIAARRLSWPDPKNRLVPGPCTQPGCLGKLVVTFADSRPRDAVCDTCGFTIPAGRVMALRRAYNSQPLLAADEVVQVTAAEGRPVAIGTLWQWKSRGWLAVYPAPDGRPRYDLRQVESVRDTPVPDRPEPTPAGAVLP